MIILLSLAALVWSPSSATAADIRYKELKLGLNELQVPPRAEEVFFLVHGIHEDGSTWEPVFPRVTSRPGAAVYFFKWNERQPVHVIQSAMGDAINLVLARHEGAARRVVVFAHSAGGALLTKSLCYVSATDPCRVDRALLSRTRAQVSFNTIASPLGGFGQRMAVFAAPVIGAVTSFMGQSIRYAHSTPEARLTVWYTRPENDENARVKDGSDNRFPVFKDEAIAYALHELPTSSHVGAVKDALDSILAPSPTLN
jgi:alpha-beta hydrolase superfamily lysophospholipase